MSGSVASFDIFDTVLTRRVGAPSAVFYFSGEAARASGLTQLPPADFAHRRVAAEHACRLRHAGREITLDQISRELAVQLSLGPEAAATLSDLELAAETALLCPVPGIAAILAAARTTSPRLLFVSDMYLPADFLRARLVEHGCWNEGDALYVSSEQGETKHAGGLFRLILEKEKLAAAQLTHAGNHADSDVASPRRLGIASIHFSAGNLNRYETNLERHAAATQGLASFHAGTSRLSRLGTAAESSNFESIRDVTAGVAAPVLTSYVSWVLREAARAGVNRLYFVARDGFLLLQLARVLAPRLCPQVELRYLHGSRQAWHLPGIFALGAAELDWLFCPTDFLSIASVCRRVGIEAAEISSALTSAGFASSDWTRNLTAAERTRLRTAIQSPEPSAVILQRAAVARELLVAYVQQEKLLAPGGCALVDLGWHGRAQDSLAKVIRSVGGTAPLGYYFGLNSASGLPELGERRAWFFDRRQKERLDHAFRGIEPLLETFCTAGHGVTTGYRRNSNTLEPILRAPSAALASWGWEVVHATVTAYGRNFAAAPSIAADDAAVRAMCRSTLELFWETPTTAEAAAWGAFPYEDDQAGEPPLPLAATLLWSQAPQILLQGRNGPHRAAWWAGSRELTPPVRRTVLNLAHWLRRQAHAGRTRFQ